MAKDVNPDKAAAAAAKGAAPKGAPAKGAPAKGTSAKATGKDEAKAQAAEKKRKAGIRGELEEMKELGSFGFTMRKLFKDSPAFAFSLVVHLILVVILALVTIAPDIKEVVESLTGTSANPNEEKLEDIKIDTAVDVQEQTEETQTFETVSTETVETQENTQFMEESAPAFSPDVSAVGIGLPPGITSNVGKTTGKGLEGRGAKSRAALVASGGGSAGSEAAVGHALKWLARHQLANGGWSCDHGKSPDHVGPVNEPGKHGALTGSTGMALLVYLGAGQTHTEGEYKEVIRKGLYFLGREMKADKNGGDLRGGGSLYDHGIATIALCESYALTQDKTLAQPAQAAINFIHYAQDKTGGGWRYTPGQAGDTSVVGWQIQALKSGHLAYLQVNPKSVAGAINFLNTMQTEDGAFYGYATPGKTPPLTAVGLLCRMYLGWKKEEPALQKGVEYLSKLGPIKNNMYHNYYATQIMRHFGGEEWTKWNAVMRDFLVSSQEVKGSYQSDKGSWKPAGQNHTTEQGGRLIETCFCTMTLEVYYRHLPLYKEAAGETDF